MSDNNAGSARCGGDGGGGSRDPFEQSRLDGGGVLGMDVSCKLARAYMPYLIMPATLCNRTFKRK
jgi:hypothetical protein